MTRLLVTGASGFVGQALCRLLLSKGHSLRATTSRPERLAVLRQQLEAGKVGLPADASVGVVCVPFPALTELDWIEACRGVDVVIHLGGRAHVLNDSSLDPIAVYRQANRDMPLALARAAASGGVKRLVFVSSIGVNGNRTAGRPFSEADLPCPHDPYSQSKLEAEIGLRQLAAETGLEVVIVRPPLVYGPGVKGNMLSLLGLVGRGWPLPLAGVKNRRSLIGIDNLVDALTICATHPRAAGHMFLVSDGEDISTPDLVRQLAAGMGRPGRLFGVPYLWLNAGAGLIGQGHRLEKLCGDLQVDSTLIRQTLGWMPRMSMKEGLRKMAEWFISQEQGT